MKLLIVEDEDLTREGLIRSLDWEEIGITEIIQAKDGQAGFELAKKELPDIILCDIRMPKMDGLDMLSAISEYLPDLVSILLTGYAEVSYLKKAIALNVINYIEKPIDIDELTAVLHTAVDQAAKLKQQRQSAQIHSSVVASRLAYQLTLPYDTCRSVVEDMFQEFLVHYGTDKFQYITTIVVRPEGFPDNSMLLYTIGQRLHDRLLPGHYHIIYTDRAQQDIIYHIYGSVKPTLSTLKMIGDIILSYYKTYTRCYISIGKTVSGIQNAFRSYQAALTNLRYIRFYEADYVLVYQDHKGDNFEEDPDSRRPALRENSARLNDRTDQLSADFQTALKEKNKEKTLQLLDSFKALWYHSTISDGLVKSVYYNMFISINRIYHDLHIVSEYPTAGPGSMIEKIDSYFNFLEVHDLLQSKIEEFFDQLAHYQREDQTIYLIREYISKHYMDPQLSVKSLSDHVYLSVSYLCTYFKNETGITLNQYITDYRIKKAIVLLTQKNMKIIDVASAVGYRDSNYFAKIFKKQTGFSPKEYKHKFS